MPTKIRVVHAHEFIQATPEGTLDLTASKALLIEIALFSAPEDDYDIILDLRGVDAKLSVAELWELAAELHRYPGVFARKTAVIVPQEDFDHTGFFASAARDQGFKVRAFTSAGEAMEWIAEA